MLCRHYTFGIYNVLGYVVLNAHLTLVNINRPVEWGIYTLYTLVYIH
jgi:hypothetical protein